MGCPDWDVEALLRIQSQRAGALKMKISLSSRHLLSSWDISGDIYRFSGSFRYEIAGWLSLSYIVKYNYSTFELLLKARLLAIAAENVVMYIVRMEYDEGDMVIVRVTERSCKWKTEHGRWLNTLIFATPTQITLQLFYHSFDSLLAVRDRKDFLNI